MSNSPELPADTMEIEPTPRVNWRLELRNAPLSAKFGLVIITFYILVAVFAPFLTPYGESEIVDFEFEPWGLKYIFGTDSLGRDVLTRLIYGARNTLGIAILTTMIAFALGVTMGLAATVIGGWMDQLLGRLVDIMMAVPQLIFALMLLTIFGTSIPILIVIIAVLDSTRVFRLTRAVSQNVVVLDFIESARLRGETSIYIAFREVLPNIIPPLVAEFGLRFCFVFLLISGLSFLGLGVQPPTADWGTMVRENATMIAFGDITPLLPAGAIALLTVAVNFVVDWFIHKSSGLKD